MGLSDHQFGKYMVTRGKSGWDNDRDRYEMWRQPEDSAARAENVGHVEVSHNPGYSFTQYPGEDRYSTSEPAEDPADHVQRYGDTWARGHQSLDGGPSQIPLFTHQSGSPRSVLDSAMMSKDARHMAPTLLGLAQRHTMDERGQVLEASDDLSPHSQRMVKHLQGLGAVPESHEFSGNSIDWQRPSQARVTGGLAGVHDAVQAGEEPSYAESPGGLETVPASDVKAGQHLVRSMLKAGRSKAGLDQGHQESLFSGDDYHESDFSLHSRDKDKERTLYGKTR